MNGFIFLWMGLWMGFLRLKNMLISQKVGFFVKKTRLSAYCLQVFIVWYNIFL